MTSKHLSPILICIICISLAPHAAAADPGPGEANPADAVDLNNRGLVLYASGDLLEAERCFERALEIAEGAFGPDHPNVATVVNNLGLALRDSGNASGAKTCFERALDIGERARGPDDPMVATYSDNLDLVLQEIRGQDIAELCLEDNSTTCGDAPGEMTARG
jgi:tetratricopeptide (TPR) repeat protein